MTAPATVSVSPHPLMPLDVFILGRRDWVFDRESGDLPNIILTAFLSGVTEDGAKYDDQKYNRNAPVPT